MLALVLLIAALSVVVAFVLIALTKLPDTAAVSTHAALEALEFVAVAAIIYVGCLIIFGI